MAKKAEFLSNKPYLEQHMSIENKRELHAIAKEKGIKELNLYVDYSS